MNCKICRNSFEAAKAKKQGEIYPDGTFHCWHCVAVQGRKVNELLAAELADLTKPPLRPGDLDAVDAALEDRLGLHRAGDPHAGHTSFRSRNCDGCGKLCRLGELTTREVDGASKLLCAECCKPSAYPWPCSGEQIVTGPAPNGVMAESAQNVAEHQADPHERIDQLWKAVEDIRTEIENTNRRYVDLASTVVQYRANACAELDIHNERLEYAMGERVDLAARIAKLEEKLAAAEGVGLGLLKRFGESPLARVEVLEEQLAQMEEVNHAQGKELDHLSGRCGSTERQCAEFRRDKTSISDRPTPNELDDAQKIHRAMPTTGDKWTRRIEPDYPIEGPPGAFMCGLRGGISVTLYADDVEYDLSEAHLIAARTTAKPPDRLRDCHGGEEAGRCVKPERRELIQPGGQPNDEGEMHPPSDAT